MTKHVKKDSLLMIILGDSCDFVVFVYCYIVEFFENSRRIVVE